MSHDKYHHGDLHQAVLDAAVQVIEQDGSGAVTLRDLARRIGVSHAAPAHHFGDKAGLFTALATQAFDLLTDALLAAEPPDDLIEAGVAYVSFATRHPAHFAVMFRPDLMRADDPALQEAQLRSQAALRRAVVHLPQNQRGPAPILTGVAAWSYVHGFATLWLQGVLPPEVGDDPLAAARAAATELFRPATERLATSTE